MKPRTFAAMVEMLELWRDGDQKHPGFRSYWFTLTRQGKDLRPEKGGGNETKVLVQLEWSDGEVREQTFEHDDEPLEKLAEMLTK